MEGTCVFPEIPAVLLARIMFQLNSMYPNDGSVTIGKMYIGRLCMSRRSVWSINYFKDSCQVNATPSHSEYSRFWSGEGFIKFVIVNHQMGHQRCYWYHSVEHLTVYRRVSMIPQIAKALECIPLIYSYTMYELSQILCFAPSLALGDRNETGPKMIRFNPPLIVPNSACYAIIAISRILWV